MQSSDGSSSGDVAPGVVLLLVVFCEDGHAAVQELFFIHTFRRRLLGVAPEVRAREEELLVRS